MTNPIEVKNCTDDSVFSFHTSGTCEFKKFRESIWEYLLKSSRNFVEESRERIGVQYIDLIRLFKNGEACQMLKPYQGWQKGKLRIKLILEFIPDEPEIIEENGHHETESPLDEIRQQLANENEVCIKYRRRRKKY
ncbi:MAG: KGK domain-containing protein [Microcoleaceae cyanobacterium]